MVRQTHGNLSQWQRVLGWGVAVFLPLGKSQPRVCHTDGGGGGGGGVAVFLPLGKSQPRVCHTEGGGGGALRCMVPHRLADSAHSSSYQLTSEEGPRPPIVGGGAVPLRVWNMQGWRLWPIRLQSAIAISLVALATKTFLEVANMWLDFTRTSSPDGRCDWISSQFRALTWDLCHVTWSVGISLLLRQISRDSTWIVTVPAVGPWCKLKQKLNGHDPRDGNERSLALMTTTTVVVVSMTVVLRMIAIAMRTILVLTIMISMTTRMMTSIMTKIMTMAEDNDYGAK